MSLRDAMQPMENTMMTKQPLPKGWRWEKLIDVTEIIMGQSPPSNTYRKEPEGLPFFQGKADFGDKHPVARNWCVEPSRVAKAGDILLSVRAPVGPTNIADVDCCIGRGLVAIRPTEKTDRDFILFALKFYENDLVKKGSGSTFDAIRKEDLHNLEIPLPPLEEQKRIAARLDEQMRHIEQARLAAEESLSAAWELEKTYLLELFGNTSNKFQTTNIGSVAKIQTGYAFKSEWFSPDGIRLLRNANVFQGYIDWGDCVRIPESRRNEFESFEMHEGDIVLSLDRPLVNNGLKVARLTPNDIPSLLLQRVARFQVSENILPDYLYLFLRSPYFIDEITQHDQSIGVPHVSPKQVEAINLSLPDLKTQEKLSKEYQEKLLHAEQLIKSLESQLAEIESLPSAVLGQAFAGEL